MKCPNCHTDLRLILTAGAPAGAAPTPVPAGGNWFCPVHAKSKIVPAGVSQRTGKPYSAFWACPEQGCDQRPPKGFPVPHSAPVAAPAAPAPDLETIAAGDVPDEPDWMK